MRLAVIADIHANLPALEAVLEAIEACKVERILCLGDLVGYNAEPSESIALVRRYSDIVIAGNHDWDVANNSSAVGTNPVARQIQKWTREQLSQDDIEYLLSLPTHAFDSAIVLAHGCYLNTTYINGYVTSTMIGENLRAIEAKEGWPKVALCGHTHVPLCGWLEGDRIVEHRLLEPVQWSVDARVVLINPGSVGQPRDYDPRAAFAIIDTDLRTVEVKRVPYDIERAAKAIQNAGLPTALADRLRTGR